MKDEELLCRIRDLQRAIMQFESGFENRYGICLNEGMALCSLRKNGKLSASELGTLLGLTHSNMSKVIKSIESKGYVQRLIGDCDKRQMYFSLTEQGRQLMSAIKCDSQEIPELLRNAI